MVSEHQGGFGGGHQAGIEAHKVEFYAAVSQCLVDLCQIHGAGGGKLLVIAVAADAAAAVIPENQGHPVGGEVLGAVADEVGEGVRIRHGLAAHAVVQHPQAPVLQLPDLVGAAGKDVVLPLLAAAGVDDQVDVVGKVSVQHLLQVGGSHGAAGFQVGAAEVEHDGHFILTAAQNFRVLLPGTGGNGGIQLAGLTCVGPAGGHGAAPKAAQQGFQVKGRCLLLPGLVGILLGLIGRLVGLVALTGIAHQGCQATAAAQKDHQQQDDQPGKSAAGGAGGSAA